MDVYRLIFLDCSEFGTLILDISDEGGSALHIIIARHANGDTIEVDYRKVCD